MTISSIVLPPSRLSELLWMIADNKLSHSQANDVLFVILNPDTNENNPAVIADSLGYKPAEAGELEALVEQAIANNPSEVEAIKGGNEKLLNFLTGQVMKLAATKPNPKQVTELLRSRLL